MAMQTPDFDYKVVDKEGHEILDVMNVADQFNRWMAETVQKFCSGNVLEIGSGTGNISHFFLDAGFKTTLSDIRESYCDVLKENFSDVEGCQGVIQMDIEAADFETKYAKYLGTFDSVFALNVVEHIKNDSLAIQNCKKLLTEGGKLIILVPANQWLYNEFDKQLFHFRRYNKSNLSTKFTDSGLKVEKCFYFNATGILGWFVSGKLQKNNSIPEGQMSFYNKFVPIFKLIDKILFNKVGLSVIAVGVK